MTNDEPIRTEIQVDVADPPPESLSSQVQRAWRAGKTAKQAESKPKLALVVLLVIWVMLLFWNCLTDLEPKMGFNFPTLFFWIPLPLVLSLILNMIFLKHRAKKLSINLILGMVRNDEPFSCSDDVIAAVSAINWTPSLPCRTALSARLIPQLEELVRSDLTDLDNVALESLTEIIRCARRPLDGYPSPELVVVSLKLIGAAGWVDALLRVEQLAPVDKNALVSEAAEECAGLLRAIVEGSNETDYLLRASRSVACDDRELGRAVDALVSFDSSEALRVVDEPRSN